jgi:PAS domain S-box-containing protein
MDTSPKPTPFDQKLFLVFIVTFASMTVFEFAAQFLYPYPPDWRSNLIAIFFTSGLAVIIAYFPLKSFYAKNGQLLSEMMSHRSVEIQLRQSEEKYRVVVENSHDAIYIHRSERLLFANSRASELTGYPHNELMEIRLWLLVHPDDRDRLIECARKRFAGEEVPPGFTARLLTKDGTSRLCEFFVDRVMFQGGPAILGIARDITERKRAEDALAVASRKLNLLSGITRHDIKNQLTALNVYIQLSESVVDEPAKLKDVFIKEQKIIDAIAEEINFTKDYEDLGVKSAVWQDVSALIRNAETALPLRNIRLDIGCSGLEVFADPLLEKVFYNLIDNSLRHGGDNMATIHITSSERGEDLQIIFEDDGIGISAEDKKQLFTKGFGKNTGLGLFLVREILSITSITIHETGEPGKGVRFEITVPKGEYRLAKNR